MELGNSTTTKITFQDDHVLTITTVRLVGESDASFRAHIAADLKRLAEFGEKHFGSEAYLLSNQDQDTERLENESIASFVDRYMETFT